MAAGSSQPPLQGQAKINQMAADAQDNTDAAARALTGFTAQLNTVSEAIQTSAREAASAQEAVTTTQGLAAQKAQQSILNQAGVLGTNPDANTFILNNIAQQYKSNNQRAQGYADDIDYALSPSNIKKDPLKWIGSALMFELNKEGQNSAERAAGRSYQEYQGLNNMTQEYAKTQIALEQTATTEGIAQSAKIAAFNLNQQANQAELQRLQLNSQAVMQALKLQNEPFDIERQRQASENDATRLGMARQQAAKQNVEMDLRIAAAYRADKREARMQGEIDKADKMEADMVGLVNVAADATGIKIHFNSVDELKMARQSPEFKERIDTLYRIGLQTRSSTRTGADGGLTSTLVISDSPTKTLSFVKGMGAKLSAGQQPVIDLIDSVRMGAIDTGLLNGKMKPNEYAQELDKTVMTAAGMQYKNITKGEKNIYAPPPLSTFLSNAEFVAGAPVIASEMKLQSDLGVKSVDFNKLTTALTQAAKTGKLPLAQIDSELKFFAHKTMAINNSLRRYDETAGLPRMTNMNVGMTLPITNSEDYGIVGVGIKGLVDAVFSDESINVDLADDVKRGAYLNKLYSRNIPQVLRQQADFKGNKK